MGAKPQISEAEIKDDPDFNSFHDLPIAIQKKVLDVTQTNEINHQESFTSVEQGYKS